MSNGLTSEIPTKTSRNFQRGRRLTRPNFVQNVIKIGSELKGLAHAKIIKKSVILFRVLNMTI